MKTMMALVFLSWIAAVVTPSAEAQLTCSPAPCVTPNIPVSASDPSTTVAGLALAASPLSSSEDLGITANYLLNMSPCFESGSDTSLSSAFTSLDQGSTWSGGCQPLSGSDVIAEYDPIAAYDSSGNLFSGQLGATSTAGGGSCRSFPPAPRSGETFSPLSLTPMQQPWISDCSRFSGIGHRQQYLAVLFVCDDGNLGRSNPTTSCFRLWPSAIPVMAEQPGPTNACPLLWRLPLSLLFSRGRG